VSLASELAERLKCDKCGAILTRGACNPPKEPGGRLVCSMAGCGGLMRLLPGEVERLAWRP
jgi:hypothetical protein